ncbi:hypothetical protein NB636_02100 [Oxalobacter aliiformigenes]|uniref:hypothetical protein n=1 Tax=Oxalobacter aliiformigenes TaxID=2946593 RepID=UPI0022AE6A98|nr:hypothetical protein [Oxalobacter aliiformigenes]MCZ4065665.1 hypothetical protein [Oxalobacter aliiformigenes]WAV99680.1 hypothetical protein NB636_02100 [Oxalobacter aliiformigenes]
MEIISNFESDIKKVVLNELSINGFDVSELEDDRVLISYLEFRKRQFKLNKRIVYQSKSFNCPNNRLVGWKKLKSHIENGDDIRHYQSKRSDDIEFKDSMLNEWGGYHFHLGENVEHDKWIERTNELVFAILTDNEFYAINVFKHGGWADKEIVEIIHDNWPHLIEPYKVRHGKISYSPVGNDRLVLRKNNINSAIELDDGTIYFPMGGGSTLSGDSINIVIKSQKLIRKLKYMFGEAKRYFEQKLICDGEFAKSCDEIKCCLKKDDKDNIVAYLSGREDDYFKLCSFDEFFC